MCSDPIILDIVVIVGVIKVAVLAQQVSYPETRRHQRVLAALPSAAGQLPEAPMTCFLLRLGDAAARACGRARAAEGQDGDSAGQDIE